MQTKAIGRNNINQCPCLLAGDRCQRHCVPWMLDVVAQHKAIGEFNLQAKHAGNLSEIHMTDTEGAHAWSLLHVRTVVAKFKAF